MNTARDDRIAGHQPTILYEEPQQFPEPHNIPISVGIVEPRALSSCGSQPTAPQTRIGRRFVAGEVFFNYEALGSLRPDLPPIRLFTSGFVGLAVSACFAGLVVTFAKSCYYLLLVDYLRVDDDSAVTSVQYMLDWPSSFALFIGLLSDCRPIRKHRRKPYMVIGWLVASFFFVLISLLDFTAASSWTLLNYKQVSHHEAEEEILPKVQKYGDLLLVLTLLAMMALEVMVVASLTLSVEFAQREPLNERGRLQASYFVVYYLAAAVAQGGTVLFVLNGHADEDGHIQSKVSLGAAAAMLAGGCLLPVPFIIFCLEEPMFKAVTVHLSLRRRVSELWRFCHHNVVVRIVAFFVSYFFLIELYNENSRKAIQAWSTMSDAKKPAANAMDATGVCVVLIVWSMFMVNWSWRRIAAVSTILSVVGYAIFTGLVVYDVVRNDWFYIISSSALDTPHTLIHLYTVLLATEIADSGREGVTTGLVTSVRVMVAVIAQNLSTMIGKTAFRVSDADIAADSDHTRHQVFMGSFTMIAVNGLAALTVLLLPLQRLDAQQLRSFGGYNRYASYSIGIVFSVLVFATSTINIVAMAS